METCMARRAHNDRYSFRLMKEAKEGKYIWTEFRCPNVVSEGAKVCADCSKKLPKYKYQSNQKCDHGLVGGPYPEDSKLYGSPFYLKQVKEGFTPLEADERRAKEAVIKATSNMPKKKVAEPVVPAEPVAAVTAIAPAVVATPVAPVKAPKKPRVAKTKATPSPLTPSNTIISAEPLKPATMLESMEAPVHVSEVIVVKVRKVKHKGKEYCFDQDSGKLYSLLADGVGPYVGRYKADSDTLDTEYPDSDVEVD
jgi:hypothetical protein